MMIRRLRDSQDGFILVMALWALGFLTVLALAIGLGTRQRIILLSRLEERSQAQFTAEAGVKKATAVLMEDLENNEFLYSPKAKIRRHNNGPEFSQIKVGVYDAEIVGRFSDENRGAVVERHGLSDERGKFNLNTVDAGALSRLLMIVLGYDADNSKRLTSDIIDWREYGRRHTEGFFSDDYYKNLEFPYAMKDKPFERIDELLLIRGMNAAIYEKLRPFVTVYGDGRININTVPKEVLLSLGLDPKVVDKVLKARRGQDNLEATMDDHVFLQTYDIPSGVNSFVLLEEKEMRQLDALNAANVFCTESSLFSFVSRTLTVTGDVLRSIDVVFDGMRNKYLYWHEK